MPLIKYNNQSLSSVTAINASIPTGKLKLISSQTASSSATISFTTGLDSTYKVYRFVFVNCHPQTDSVAIQFNGSTDSGSNYNVTKTTTFFAGYHDEADTTAGIYYDSDSDLAQSTAFQNLTSVIGNDNDQAISGSLTLFNPSSTTYVKHFISRISLADAGNLIRDDNVAGYFNTTSAINAIRFKMSSGNIDAGTIYLYGIDNS